MKRLIATKQWIMLHCFCELLVHFWFYMSINDCVFSVKFDIDWTLLHKCKVQVLPQIDPGSAESKNLQDVGHRYESLIRH